MSTEKILARVRKLLALANDAAATEGERDNALRMAYAALAKHNLDMADVEKAGGAQSEKRAESTAALVVYPWARSVAGAVGRLFFCEYCFSRPESGKTGKHYFIGRESNSVTASEMTAYLVTSIMKEAAKLYGTGTSTQVGDFCKGAAARLFQRVQSLRESNDTVGDSKSTALALTDLYAQEKAENILWMTSSNIKTTVAKGRQQRATDPLAYGQGRSYGGSLSLNNQVGNKASVLPRLK